MGSEGGVGDAGLPQLQYECLEGASHQSMQHILVLQVSVIKDHKVDI